jgi:hypothetical protein
MTGECLGGAHLLQNNFDNDVATISRNVIERFIDPGPFEITGPVGEDGGERQPPHPDYD